MPKKLQAQIHQIANLIMNNNKLQSKEDNSSKDKLDKEQIHLTQAAAIAIEISGMHLLKINVCHLENNI